MLGLQVTKYNLLDPPSIPDTVSVQSTTYNSATIQWTEPSDNGGSDITGYNITISPSTSTCSSCDVSSDTLMYNITELNHTINYTISVAAINCVGTGDSVFLEDLDIIAKGNCSTISITLLCRVCST